MSDTTPTRRAAWQPLTFGGIAAFAHAGFGRTLGVALAVALIDALLVFGAFQLGWLPVLNEAVESLPERGEIRGRVLNWSGETPHALSGSPLLQIVVDAENTGTFGHESDLRLELRRHDYRLCGAFGCLAFAYPEGWIVAVNRPELVPLWGAWQPFVCWGVFLGTAAALLASWVVIAVLAALPLFILAFQLDRDTTPAGCVRLALAALQPAGLFLATVIFFYGLRQVGVFELLVCFALHFLIGILFMFIAVLRLDRKAPTRAVANPFVAEPAPASPAPALAPKNPFQSGPPPTV